MECMRYQTDPLTTLYIAVIWGIRQGDLPAIPWNLKYRNLIELENLDPEGILMYVLGKQVEYIHIPSKGIFLNETTRFPKLKKIMASSTFGDTRIRGHCGHPPRPPISAGKPPGAFPRSYSFESE